MRPASPRCRRNSYPIRISGDTMTVKAYFINQDQTHNGSTARASTPSVARCENRGRRAGRARDVGGRANGIRKAGRVHHGHQSWRDSHFSFDPRWRRHVIFSRELQENVAVMPCDHYSLADRTDVDAVPSVTSSVFLSRDMRMTRSCSRNPETPGAYSVIRIRSLMVGDRRWSGSYYPLAILLSVVSALHGWRARSILDAHRKKGGWASSERLFRQRQAGDSGPPNAAVLLVRHGISQTTISGAARC